MIDPFDERVKLFTDDMVKQYNRANLDFPSARAVERQLLIDRLDLVPGLTICDVIAGGGYVAEGIWDALGGDCHIICVENSEAFVKTIDPKFECLVSSLGRIQLPDSSVDRISCCAGIHHQHDKITFFKEAFRILRPGGLLVVADVLEESPPAKWLNIVVDQYGEEGHEGIFLKHGEMSGYMTIAGFEAISESYEQYTWNCRSRAELITFCQTLFRMTKATREDVEHAMKRYMRVDVLSDRAEMGWSLIYAKARKPLL